MPEEELKRPGPGPPPLITFKRAVPPASHLQPRVIASLENAKPDKNSISEPPLKLPKAISNASDESYFAMCKLLLVYGISMESQLHKIGCL